jgi:hypothetical protein
MGNNNILDYPEERYLKYKSTAEKFKIIQIGICCFSKSKENNGEYTAKPYTFFIFPEENSGNNFINCETNAIIFNRDHKMDFNKWIYEGSIKNNK